MNFKSEIIAYANSIGISKIGFTDAEAFNDIKEILKTRKESGFLSGFEEKDLELRINPKKTMPEAKSIIVIAIPYYRDRAEAAYEKLAKYHGDLARLAWGRDYHFVLRDKLQKIANFIKEQESKFQYKIFVDTGPLVDRHVAYRAGLGWYGYNSLLINEEFGSWFFIGYMINNLLFPIDKPLTNKACQACNLCIKHCPSGAIEAPYSFDAKKCLSYLLQEKSEISRSDRKLVGKKIYGCDICQEVCPHNNQIQIGASEEFYPIDPLTKPDLLKLLTISNKEFKDTYGKTSAGWRGKKILQRNAIIALANYGNKEVLPYLIPLLKDERWEIRKYAIWAIYELDPLQAKIIFKEMFENEKDIELKTKLKYYIEKKVDNKTDSKTDE